MTRDRFIFKHVAPRTEQRERHLYEWASRTPGHARLSLWAMYLSIAEEIPRIAKTSRGWSFGFCDAAGTHYGSEDERSTHIGWTFDEEIAPDPLRATS